MFVYSKQLMNTKNVLEFQKLFSKLEICSQNWKFVPKFLKMFSSSKE